MRHYLIPRKLALLFAGFLAALMLANVIGLFSPKAIVGKVPVYCLFKKVTTIPCPGCGMMRAITSIAAGKMTDALLYNPFSFFLIFIVVLSILPERWLNRISPLAVRVLPDFYGVVLGLLVLFWVFDRLLPHFMA